MIVFFERTDGYEITSIESDAVPREGENIYLGERDCQESIRYKVYDVRWSLIRGQYRVHIVVVEA